MRQCWRVIPHTTKLAPAVTTLALTVPTGHHAEWHQPDKARGSSSGQPNSRRGDRAAGHMAASRAIAAVLSVATGDGPLLSQQRDGGRRRAQTSPAGAAPPLHRVAGHRAHVGRGRRQERRWCWIWTRPWCTLHSSPSPTRTTSFRCEPNIECCHLSAAGLPLPSDVLA